MTRAIVEGQQGAAPGAFEQHLEEGGALLSAGRLDEALGHLETAHALQPGNDTAQNLLGLCCFKLGHLDRAAEIYELLVRDNPADATLRVNLGLVYLKANALQRAVREFETATDLSPDHRRAHNYLGLALAQAGEYGRAREHFVLAGSEHMAERMARALDGAGFEPGSTPAGGTLVIRARPSQVPAAADVEPRSALDDTFDAPGSEVGPEASALPVYDEQMASTLPPEDAPYVDPSAPQWPTPAPGTPDAQAPMDAGVSMSEDDGVSTDASASEGWDDDWNLEPVGGQEVGTAPDGGPVASLRPARLEDSWGAQFGLEGEAPTGDAGEAAEELVVELHADDEEPAPDEASLDFGVDGPGPIEQAQMTGSMPGEADPSDGWIDGGSEEWGEEARTAAPEAAWVGEASPELANANGAWPLDPEAAGGAEPDQGWTGEAPEGAAWDAAEAGVQDAIPTVPEATWGVPHTEAPVPTGDDAWEGFEEGASQAGPFEEPSGEAAADAQAREEASSRPTFVPPPAAAPEPDWARAQGRRGQTAGAWLAELSRGLVLGHPLSGDEAFSVAPDGVTAIRLSEGLRTRTAGFLALEGEVQLTPEPRRKHGRATGQTYGPAGRELLRVRGEGLLHVRVPGHRLVPLELGEEGVYLREQAAYAFEESVMFENGALSDGESTDLGIVHLRGAGRILLELEGELRTVAVNEGVPVSVEVSRLVGWLGEVAPQLLPAVTGLAARVVLKGSGFALLDAASRGTSA